MKHHYSHSYFVDEQSGTRKLMQLSNMNQQARPSEGSTPGPTGGHHSASCHKQEAIRRHDCKMSFIKGRGIGIPNPIINQRLRTY